MNKRAVKLLIEAAIEFNSGGNPFEGDWLAVRGATSAESEKLAQTIGLATAVFVAAATEANKQGGVEALGEFLAEAAIAATLVSLETMAVEQPC